MRIEESIVVDRTPEEVFAFLEQRENDRAWMAVVRVSEWLDEAEAAAVGRRGRMVLKSVTGTAVYLDEVTAYEPGRRIAHRTVEEPVDLKTACICEPAGGGSLVTVVAEADNLARLAVSNRFVARLTAPLLVPMVRRGFRGDLKRLKKVLEQPMGELAKA